MSYNIIKSIKVKDNRVFVASACNNVWLRTYEEFEAKSDKYITKAEEELNG